MPNRPTDERIQDEYDRAMDLAAEEGGRMSITTGGRVRLVWTPPTKGRPNGTVHRNTCEKAGRFAQPAERVAPGALHDATKATCCSPRQFDIRNAIAAGESTTTEENSMTTTTAAKKTAATKAPATKKVGPKATATNKKTAALKGPSAKKATAAPARTKVGTFSPTGKGGETYKCQGACGETLSVKKFPTVTGTDKRSVECRTDRDARTKAEKEARQKAKAAAK